MALPVAPRQEHRTLIGDAPSYQSPHVFSRPMVARYQNEPLQTLCPIEDAICQSMLHIAESFRRFAGALELRIVYDKLGLSTSRAAMSQISL